MNKSWLETTANQLALEKSITPADLPSEFFAEDNTKLIEELRQNHPALINGIELDTPFLPKTIKVGEIEYEVKLEDKNNKNGKNSIKLVPNSQVGTSIYILQIDPVDEYADGVIIETQTQYLLRDKCDSYVEKIQTFTSDGNRTEELLTLRIANNVLPVETPISTRATHTEISVVKSANRTKSEDDIAVMVGGYSDQSGSIKLTGFWHQSRKNGVWRFNEVPEKEGELLPESQIYWQQVAETYASLLLNGKVEISNQPKEVINSIT